MNPGPTEFVLAAPAGVHPPADVWSNLDMAAITSSLRDTGVWAPADQQSGLKALVGQAADDGHSLHVVVLQETYPKFTAYRDIATELQSHVGGTVLVFGPGGSGTASNEFSRVDLEDASNSVTKGSTATQAASQVYHGAIDPNVNWNGVTIGLIVLVVIGAVIARLTMKRRRRAATVAAGTSSTGTSSTGTQTTGGAATDDDSQDSTETVEAP